MVEWHIAFVNLEHTLSEKDAPYNNVRVKNVPVTQQTCHIFNISLTSGTIPSVWKSAQVVPLLKKVVTQVS